MRNYAKLLLNGSPLLWLRFGALTLIFVLCIATLVAEGEGGHVGWRWPTLVIASFASYAVVFFRSTAPFPARAPWQNRLLLVQLALSLPFDTNLTVVTTATIPLVTQRRHWRIWFVATIVFVALAGVARSAFDFTRNEKNFPAGTVWTDLFLPVASGLLEVLAWHLFAFLAAILIVHFDEDRRRLSHLNAELKGSQALLLESSRLAERLRISRELHDSAGHHLTSLSLQLEIAGHLPDEELRPRIAQARFIAKLLLADIREAVSEWLSETSTALPDALAALAASIAGPRIVLDLETAIPAASPMISHTLFRCAQEAITNAIKHGGARTIAIGLRYREGRLSLAVDNDGRGITAIRYGNGLEGMRSRLSEFGGTLSIDSAPGEGFRLRIEVPLEEVSLQ